MKNAEQLVADIKADEGLRKKFHEGLNKLRSDETLSIMEAGQRVARELGYEVKDDEAKKFVARMQARGQDKTKLSDKELDNVAGGICGSYCGHACGNCFDLDW
ncbi:MAG: hypothetical protein IJU15_06500 [Synergistaceae bacterium]|nr:hypothetical protein [Synergistaceae bacterium]